MMFKLSTVVVAAIALNAAGTMAAPRPNAKPAAATGSSSSVASSASSTATGSATSSVPLSSPGPSTATGTASTNSTIPATTPTGSPSPTGAATGKTITVNLIAQPTACKAGQTPSWDNVQETPLAGGAPASKPTGLGAPPAGPKATPAPGPKRLVARAPKPHGGAKPATPNHSSNLGIVLVPGADGTETKVHVLPATTTLCYAPSGAVTPGGGKGKKRSKQGDGDEHAQRIFAGSPKAGAQAKLVARALDMIAEYMDELD